MIEELALKAGYIPFQFTSLDTLRRFAGIEVVAHVHDEIVAGGCRSEDLYAVMSRMPDWSDLVVPVKVERGERYGE